MTLEERTARTAEFALSKKAENVLSMDLRGLSSACDIFVICTGTSDVQMKAIADAIKDGMTEGGEKPWHVEGAEGNRWILLDFIDIVVHVFNRETRDYYQLERLWGDAKIEIFEDEPPTNGE